MEKQQQVGLNELLEAGVHFGHQTRRWNPKMGKFIFTERNGIHIIDLRKTLDRLVIAQEAVRQVVLSGERVLFVCTKGQLRAIIEQEAQRCGAFYVTDRWLGGMLTNFQTIRKQIRRLRELERGQEESAFEFYTKKERLLLDRERLKLDKYLSGVKDMSRLPGVLFVVDVKREAIAIHEAARLGIPVIAITDTNANPELVEFPVPGNDDAIRSVGLITKAIAESVREASARVPEEQKRRVHEAQATTYSTETGETTESTNRAGTAAKRRRRVPRVDIVHEKDEGLGKTPVPQESEGAEGSVEEKSSGSEDAIPVDGTEVETVLDDVADAALAVDEIKDAETSSSSEDSSNEEDSTDPAPDEAESKS